MLSEKMKRNIISVFFGFCVIISARASAEVFVSKRQSFFLPVINDTVLAGQMKWWPLSNQNETNFNREDYQVYVSVSSAFPDRGGPRNSDRVLRWNPTLKTEGNYRYDKEKKSQRCVQSEGRA